MGHGFPPALRNALLLPLAGRGARPPPPDAIVATVHCIGTLSSLLRVLVSGGIGQPCSSLPAPDMAFPRLSPRTAPFLRGRGRSSECAGGVGDAPPLPASRHPQGRWPPRSTAGDKPAPAPSSSGQEKTGTGVQQSRFPARYSGPGRFTGCVSTRRVCSL